jgi:hypothetical protein
MELLLYYVILATGFSVTTLEAKIPESPKVDEQLLFSTKMPAFSKLR